jgi:hypothetical protein
VSHVTYRTSTPRPGKDPRTAVFATLPRRPGRGRAGLTGPGAGHAVVMTVTDPDVPDPLNDPRTAQADPGAHGQGADLASTGDEPTATGEDELAAGRTEADDAGGGDVTGGAFSEGPSR